MNEEIKNFYDKTKSVYIDGQMLPLEEWPVTWKRVFYKNYPRFPKTKLPNLEINKNLQSVLSERKSTREFSTDPVSLEEISILLNSSCGLVEEIKGKDKTARRKYPSAGGRFPVETYLASFNVEGLNEGIYHYEVQTNSLEHLLIQDISRLVPSLFGGILKKPAAGIILTSVINRSEVKYGIHAYRFSLLEAGHIGQNIYLVSQSLNLGCCAIGGFDNETITKTIDLTEEELPIYVLGIGKKQD